MDEGENLFSWEAAFSGCVFVYLSIFTAMHGFDWPCLVITFNEKKKKKGIWEKIGSFESNNKIKNLPHPDPERKFY